MAITSVYFVLPFLHLDLFWVFSKFYPLFWVDFMPNRFVAIKAPKDSIRMMIPDS